MLEQGQTLLIANPAARSGAGAKATAEAGRILKEALGERFDMVRTMQPRHAVDLAEQASAYDTVLVLGGDGIIHEAANGLMRIPQEQRPALGIIPVGSGNDYARTLGMSTTPAKACDQLLHAEKHPLDLGCVNGEYYTQTLSFGLDAAIALETMELRKKHGAAGVRLYAQSGIDQLTHHLTTLHYRARFDGEEAEGQSITFAVQMGPTYGGGFRICPDASPSDGLFDICIAHPPVSVARALFIFARAKSGRHVGFKQMELRQAENLQVEFDEQPPCQVDGERLEARSFDVRSHPGALNVLLPA